MKVLHVIQPDKKFLRSIVSFIAEKLPHGEHEILYINRVGNQSNILEDINIQQQEIFHGFSDLQYLTRFKKIIDQYDFLVFHSLFLNLSLKWFIKSNRCILKKIIWVEFGNDLYYRLSLKGLKKIIHGACNDAIANNCAAFVGIFPPDCEYFKNIYSKSNAKIFYAPYTGAEISSFFFKNISTIPLNEKKNTDQPVLIQIGHNGMETLNHIKTLKLLKKYKDCNIKILLTLSYGGSKKYRSKVKQYAEKEFPGKIICLEKMMPLEEYNNLISNVDICIFNTYRQTALANIHRMIWSNVKLYMPSESVMYHFFSSKGVPAFSRCS